MKILAMICMLFAFAVQGATLTWSDNSDNEDGFIVERRLFQDTKYTQLTILPRNTTIYSDNTTNSGEIYCYKVGAFNRAGIAYSGRYCISIPTAKKVKKGKGYGKGGKK